MFKILILVAVISVISAEIKKPTVNSVQFDEVQENNEINTAPYSFPHTPQRSNPYYNQNPIRLYSPQNYRMQAHPSNRFHSEYNPGYDHPMFAEPPPDRWGPPYPPPIEDSDTGMAYWIPTKQEKRYITVPSKYSKTAIKTPITHVKHQNNVSTVKPTTTSSNINVEDTKNIAVQTTTEYTTTSKPVIDASSTEVPEQPSEELENVKLRHHLKNEHNCAGYGEDHKEESNVSQENVITNETTMVPESIVQETTANIIIKETSPVSINEDNVPKNENIIEVVVPSAEAAVVGEIVAQPSFRRKTVLPPDFEDLPLYGHNYAPPPFLRRSYPIAPYAYPRLSASLYSGEPGQPEMFRRNMWNPAPQFAPSNWPKRKHHVAPIPYPDIFEKY